MFSSTWSKGGLFLLFIGLIAGIVGTLNGCNSLFGWNGRHAIDTQAVTEEATTRTFTPEAGRRYTVSVQVVFDREGLERKEGVIAFEAKLPINVKVKDPHGTKLAEAIGWLDPNEAPNVLYNQAAHESMRGPMPELFVERLIGPFAAASSNPITVEMTLGADRVGSAKVVSKRLVIHDDALPPVIRNAFIVAASGTVAFLAGIIFLVIGWFRSRGTVETAKSKKRLGGNPRSEIV